MAYDMSRPVTQAQITTCAFAATLGMVVIFLGMVVVGVFQ
jgi:hypothetical protein